MTNKKIQFDPGYAPLVIDSIGQVGYTYYAFGAIRDLKIKRINFIPMAKKINEHLKVNIAFYLGCLLWASYIGQFENLEIEGNQLLGEVCDEEEYTSEINFLIDFVEKQFPRDYKYYLNKNYEADRKYLPILKAYKDFLILNKGFVECAKTSQIILPKNLKKCSKETLELINKNIQEALNKKDVTMLFDSFELIFNI